MWLYNYEQTSRKHWRNGIPLRKYVKLIPFVVFLKGLLWAKMNVFPGSKPMGKVCPLVLPSSRSPFVNLDTPERWFRADSKSSIIPPPPPQENAKIKVTFGLVSPGAKAANNKEWKLNFCRHIKISKHEKFSANYTCKLALMNGSFTKTGVVEGGLKPWFRAPLVFLSNFESCVSFGFSLSQLEIWHQRKHNLPTRLQTQRKQKIWMTQFIKQSDRGMSKDDMFWQRKDKTWYPLLIYKHFETKTWKSTI